MNDSYYLFADRNKKRKYSVAGNFLFLEKQLWKFDKILVAAQLGVTVTYLVGGYIGNIFQCLEQR